MISSPPDAAVAVAERVDGLKVLVHQCAANEGRHRGLVVDERFPLGHQIGEVVGRWWHEAGGLDGVLLRPDPDLQIRAVPPGACPARARR